MILCRILLLAFFTLFTSTSLWATTVELVWPFSISSSTTNYLRLMIDQANQLQKNYNFILVHKPGAGGSIAANYVKTNKSIALLVTSNAFFVRPYLYPTQSHKFADFKPIMLMGQMPVAFIGRQNTDWSRLVQQKQISIGIVGLGSFSHVLAQKLVDVYSQTVIVPYQGTTEACKDVVAGIIDLCIDVPSMALVFPDSLKIYFITGENDFSQQFSLGSNVLHKVFSQFNLEFSVLARSDLDANTFNEVSATLDRAHSQNKQITQLYQQDFVTPITLEKEMWYTKNITQWKSFTSKISIDSK